MFWGSEEHSLCSEMPSRWLPFINWVMAQCNNLDLLKMSCALWKWASFNLIRCLVLSLSLNEFYFPLSPSLSLLHLLSGVSTQGWRASPCTSFPLCDKRAYILNAHPIILKCHQFQVQFGWLLPSGPSGLHSDHAAEYPGEAVWLTGCL